MPISAELSRLGGTAIAYLLVSTPTLAQEAQVLWQSDGFALPESVLWEAETALFSVSNMGVDPMAKDGDGTIATLDTIEPSGVLDGIASDGKDGVVLTDNGAGTVLHQVPGGVPEVIATIASGAADLDYDSEAGVIVVPITTEGRIVALKWSPM